MEKWGRKSCQLSVSVSCIPIHCVSPVVPKQRRAERSNDSTLVLLLGEWNTILLTPVNRWLYDCLFLLVEEGKIWPPLLPDFYDPESTFVTECCRSPKLYCPCSTSSMKLKRYYYTTSFHCSWESLSSNWLVNLEKHFRDWGSTHTEWFQLFSHSPKYSKYKYLCK